jgi:serine/threonine protein kinase
MILGARLATRGSRGTPRHAAHSGHAKQPSATSDAARLRAALLDRYRIERELGAGGMATVYFAHDLRHDRRVALNVLRPALAAAMGAEKSLTEIRTTANLQHPHIVPLHDSGEVDGTVFQLRRHLPLLSVFRRAVACAGDRW